MKKLEITSFYYYSKIILNKPIIIIFMLFYNINGFSQNQKTGLTKDGYQIWELNGNFDAYTHIAGQAKNYSIHKVGIGLITPASNLHLHNANPSQSNLSKGQSTGNGNEEPPNISQHLTTTFQLTNTNTGKIASDGLLIQSSDNDAMFKLQEDGNMSFMTNKNKGFYINNNGNTGIGIETPQSTLHIHNSTTASSGGGNIGTGGYEKSGEVTNETASTIQITNASTGSGENNGLFISAFEKSGIINLNEIGYFDIKMQDESALRINSNKKIQLSSLAGSNNRIVVADNNGNLKADLELNDLSLWHKNGTDKIW